MNAGMGRVRKNKNRPAFAGPVMLCISLNYAASGARLTLLIKRGYEAPKFVQQGLPRFWLSITPHRFDVRSR
jgi:hypothetical protein